MDRNALSDSFRSKRDKLNDVAHRLRDQRDKLNDETKRHSMHRDELNAQVRAIVERANAYRATRDETNKKVRETKALRDERNKIAHTKAEALQALRRDHGHAGQTGASPAKLQAEIRQLEYQQQTTVLTPKKEKALIDLISSKLKEIKRLTEEAAAPQESVELQKALDELTIAKAAAEEAHAAVTALAVEAQAAHEGMLQQFAEADVIRSAADTEQAAFVRNKVEADKVHREYIETVTSIRDFDRVGYAIHGQAPPESQRRGEERGAPTQAQRNEADDIFERFRQGEKLSTEDLIALQKGGRL